MTNNKIPTIVLIESWMKDGVLNLPACPQLGLGSGGGALLADQGRPRRLRRAARGAARARAARADVPGAVPAVGHGAPGAPHRTQHGRPDRPHARPDAPRPGPPRRDCAVGSAARGARAEK